MKRFSTIKHNIRLFAEKEGVSIRKIYEMTGMKDGTLSNASGMNEENLLKFFSSFPEVNLEWLLTGKGDMLLSDEKTIEQQRDLNNYKLIPLSTIEALFLEESRSDSQHFVPFMQARDTDRAIFVSGNSMAPKYPAGSIAQIRQVINWQEYLDTGEDMMYVVLLTDGRSVLREVHKGGNDEVFILHSLNNKVDDVEVPKHLIKQIWSVLASYQRMAL